MTRLLLVDDDIVVRTTLSGLLSVNGFAVTTAGSVREALKLICSETYDVLLSDLHMPGAGDGLTVISSMRHANPNAVTLLLSAFPEMAAATRAILQQADEVLTKPIDITALVEVIRERVSVGPVANREILSVAEILARTVATTTELWFETLKKEDKVFSVSMTQEQRCGHLPRFFLELDSRLQSPKPIGGNTKVSSAASAHGLKRRQQHYTAAMLVEEYRVLQISIFQTLQNNLATIDYNQLIIGIMVIADEIAFQLSQAMASYIEGTKGDPYRLELVRMNRAGASNASFGDES